MSKFHTFGATTYSLGASIGSTDSSILLSSFLEPVTGTPYTMALINSDIVYGTIAPKTSSAEFISFTGITQNANGTATLTGVVRGLAKKYPFTTSSAYKLPHAGQSQFIISDAPQVFEEYSDKSGDDIITGTWTFTNPNVPRMDADHTYGAGEGKFLATKKYVDDTASYGAPMADDTIYGISKLSTAPATPGVPISVGDNDGRVPTQGENDALVGNNTDVAIGTGNKFVTQTGLQHNAEKYAADAGANDTYVITLSPVPTSYTNGMVVHFKANTINTGAATLNVNGLGPITIVKYVNTTLADGDIAAGMFCTVIYDGTNFVLQNPIATVPITVGPIFTNGTTTKDAADASTTQNIAHGLGKIPKKVKIIAMLSPNNTQYLQAITVYNGSTQSSNSVYSTSATNVTTFTLGASNTGYTQTGVVTFDTTNIIITWTKTTNPSGIYNLLWEAEG